MGKGLKAIPGITETASPSTAVLPAEMITLVLSLTEFEAQPLELSDDLPVSPIISQSELDAIERYMGDILDKVLCHAAGNLGSTSHTVDE